MKTLFESVMELTSDDEVIGEQIINSLTNYQLLEKISEALQTMKLSGDLSDRS